MKADEDALLEVDNLRTQFDTPGGLLTAVDGVSFSLPKGRSLGVVGESGSGKSVMSRSIMRLLPKANIHTEGTVRFKSKNLMELAPRDLRKLWGPEMAMIFQDPLGSLNPVVKVGKQVAEGLRVHSGFSKKEARSEALKLLREVGISEPERRLDEYPHQFSGGMRQRIVIAIALACRPDLLIADEPTTALDVTVQAQILDLIEEQRNQRNMSLILVTHDLGVVAGRTDEIMVMYAGRVVERAPTKVLFANMKMPYTEALLESIPKLERPSHSHLLSIPGQPPNMVDAPRGCKFASRCKYVQDRCVEEEPELISAGTPGHLYRCFFPVGSSESADALARNMANGKVDESGSRVHIRT
jgi:peptide/nickel transport system ATP-binding protein|tara:strand:- start:4528 stop:5595 length:1068 start_codon:yes stop_codon:yes gene_type:complete